MQPLQQQTSRSKSLAERIAKATYGLPFDAKLNFRQAAACFSVALAHHAAIPLLIQNNIYSTAFALVRPQVEAFVRGVWLLHCASEAELNRFTEKDDIKLEFWEMLEKIECLEGYDSKFFSTFKNSYWKQLCSYTHCGSMQTHRHQSAEAIEQNFSNAELQEVLYFGDFLGLLVACELAGIANREDLANNFLAEAKLLEKPAHYGTPIAEK